MSDNKAGAALVLIGAVMALIAVLPAWIRRPLVTSLRRGQARMRITGERNPYFGSDTDEQRFFRYLRLMALVGAVLSIGSAVWAFTSG